MLVLSRRAGETVRIGDDIVVVVVGGGPGNVKLGIEAPPEVRVFRGEIYDALAAANKEAAGGKEMGPAVLAMGRSQS